MNVLKLAIVLFAFMELSNVLILYFKPNFKYGNSMRAFIAFEESKENHTNHLFVKYMTNWVANCKMIFIALLLGVCLFDNIRLLRLATLLTIFSIAIYFITLYPLIKELDNSNKIQPKGYSKTLSIMIASFMLLFISAYILSYFTAF